MHASIFYGVYYVIPSDSEDSEKVEEYEALPNAQMEYEEGGSFTLYFGIPLTLISSEDNGFDEMALLRVMDLEKGTLDPSVRQRMEEIIQEIPYDLREKLSAPGFHVAWGDV